MEKLDKVIAGLEFCGEANKSVDACLAMCPYYGERDGDKVCMDFLMADALELLKRMENVRGYAMDIKNENKRLIRELESLRAERHAEVEPARWEWGRRFSSWGIFCSNCGTGWSQDNGCDIVALAENHKYCPNCGKPMLFDEMDWVAQDTVMLPVEE